MEETRTIDLADSRKVVFRQGARQYALTMRRAEAADWMEYFDSIVTTAEQHGRELVRETDTTAGISLVEKLLSNAEGYTMPAGVESLDAMPDWPSRIPMGHRMACLDILLDATAAPPPDDAPLGFDTETVAVTSKWTADAEGRMVAVTGIHHFEVPSAEDSRNYMRRVSRSKVVGGSRSGKTIYTGAQKELVAIYDKLIRSADGYVVNGQPLEGPEQIREWMDTRHKVAAAQQLFASLSVEE